LNRLLQARIPSDKILTVELAEAAAEFTQESGSNLAIVIDRRGQVVNVTVGNPVDVQLPELRSVRVGPGRLCGHRIIYTQLPGRQKLESGQSIPNKEDLQSLAKN